MSMRDLKPCPFCGGTASVIRVRGLDGGYKKMFIYCTACGIRTAQLFTDYSEAKNVWNTRKCFEGCEK